MGYGFRIIIENDYALFIGGAKITETTIHTVTEMKGLAEQAKIN